MIRFFTFAILSSLLTGIFSCKESKKQAEEVHFSREDSITDRYLVLQDSVLYTWNMMMNDDNQKLKAMKNLLHELSVGKQFEQAKLDAFNQRLEQLWRIRFTQRTMINPDVIEEYDFASNALVTELIALTTSAPNYDQNTTLQTLAENISLADQRVYIYRAEYDAVASRYNDFITKYRAVVKSIDENCSLEKKPLFEIEQVE